MIGIHRQCLALLVIALAPFAGAQTPPPPQAEHLKLKELEGTWDATATMGGVVSKGVMVYKMELGGLWLVSEYKGEIGGDKFSGRGMDTYDPARKKYVGVWCDSMSSTPMISEGSFDKNGKVLTMTADAPGPDGKLTKYKMTSEYRDRDTIVWTMSAPGPEGKDQTVLSIIYKRRK
jgi:hypothetical protein